MRIAVSPTAASRMSASSAHAAPSAYAVRVNEEMTAEIVDERVRG
jgi:hypothetical protein